MKRKHDAGRDVEVAISPGALKLAAGAKRVRSAAEASAIEVPGAGEALERAFDLHKAFADVSDVGCRIIAEFVGDLTLPEMAAVIPWLKHPPKTKGRKLGSGKRAAEISAAHTRLLARLEREPSITEIAQELGRTLKRGEGQIQNIRRDIYRHARVTKIA